MESVIRHWNGLPSGEFTNFGDIKEMCGHGSKGYGLVVDLVVRLIAGLDDLKGLLQPK